MKADVILTAQDASAELVRNKTGIVIDVLRATSTMSTALANGATSIYAVTSPERAFELASEYAEDTVLIGGERGGIRVDGFDLGNSPREYTPAVVGGKTIIMTTSNGTLAISNSSEADELLLCSLLNCSAVAERARSQGRDVAVVCAGGYGLYTLEDAYCAGMVIDRLASVANTELTDLAVTCRALYLQYKDAPLELLNTATSGKGLIDLGFGDDLKYCSNTDSLTVVPYVKDGVIRA